MNISIMCHEKKVNDDDGKGKKTIFTIRGQYPNFMCFFVPMCSCMCLQVTFQVAET